MQLLQETLQLRKVLWPERSMVLNLFVPAEESVLLHSVLQLLEVLGLQVTLLLQQ